MTRAWIALGANLGRPATMLERALSWLSALPGTALEARSSWHRTPPLLAPGGAPQPDYLNGVLRLATRLSPLLLFGALQTLERAGGRVRDNAWGPRTLDLDLLMMGRDGALVVATDGLVLPHPRMLERRFVLAPLAEIDPTLILSNGLSVRAQLGRID